jgi:hypothetical protein
MRGSRREIAEYLADLALLFERFGVELDSGAHGDDLVLREGGRDGDLSFALGGSLPGDQASAGTVIVREVFARAGPDVYERSQYAYEIVDRERDCRRAFHLHFPEWFAREHLVLVHEHCERPIGHAVCPHYEGSPIRDAFAGVMALMEIWTGDAPDCADLRCLE